MKNYYKILQIDKNASQDVIEKVYKILVKKYHPDLQPDPSKKSYCEAQIKEINEAYEVLSDKTKKEQYDAELAKLEEEKKVSTNTSQSVQNQNQQPKSNNVNTANTNNNQVNNQQYKQSQPNYSADDLERIKKQQKDYQNAINKAYHDAYIQDLRNRGYRIRYKKTWHDRLRTLVAILITIAVLIIIFQLPPVKDYFNHLYQENEVFHGIIDTFKSFFGQ